MSELMRLLWEEGKSRPLATIGMMFLWAAVPYVYHNAASAKDVAVIKNGLLELATNYKIGQLETKLQATESEMFQINQRIIDRKTSNRYVDPLNYDRANELLIEKERLERKLIYVRTHG